MRLRSCGSMSAKAQRIFDVGMALSLTLSRWENSQSAIGTTGGAPSPPLVMTLSPSLNGRSALWAWADSKRYSRAAGPRGVPQLEVEMSAQGNFNTCEVIQHRKGPGLHHASIRRAFDIQVICRFILLMSSTTNAQGPFYHPGDVIRISITFDGPDADKISLAKIDSSIQKTREDQSGFLTEIFPGESKKDRTKHFRGVLQNPENQASGEYPLVE